MLLYLTLCCDSKKTAEFENDSKVLGVLFPVFTNIFSVVDIWVLFLCFLRVFFKFFIKGFISENGVI